MMNSPASGSDPGRPLIGGHDGDKPADLAL